MAMIVPDGEKGPSKATSRDCIRNELCLCKNTVSFFFFFFQVNNVLVGIYNFIL